ncbi:MAG: efflux RND transporter periplasmic adaptor subunit [Gemmatimonadetes bacterium]|nr:efflux RND transporter periplasmic adaptor subunit [Gemmatimonadota bacterium]
MNDVSKRRGASRRTVRVRASGWVLAAVPLGLACSNRRQVTPPAVPVTVAQAEQRTVPFEITAPGTVEPMRAVAVSAQVSGIVTSVRFREGDDVREGEVLGQIDPRPYRNALQQAEATLARDLIQLANARRQVERYQGLAQSEYITTEQFEALQTSAQALEATVQSDSAAVDNARLNLEYTTIRSPISGRTGSLLIKEGNVVRAQGSGPLVTVNQTQPILVRFAVPAPFLPVIRQHQGGGLVARVRPTNDTASLSGTLIFVDNAVDTTTGTIMLKARFANPGGQLWPGQFVTATLVVYEERDVVLVPVPAVVEAEGGTYVYVVSTDNQAETRPVVVGRSVGDDVVVTQGLAAGETIVTDGQLRLFPGARVQIRNVTDPRRGRS